MIYTESPRRKQITQQVSWGHWFAVANIVLAIAISSVYLLSTPIADTPISFVYLFTTWLGHTSFITFLGFIILIMPLCYQVTNLHVLKATASIIAAIGLALLAFDALLYNKTGVHLTFNSAQLIKSEAQVSIGAFGWLQWFYFILLVIMWLMFQLVIANAIFKRIKRFQKLKFGPYILIILGLCFVTSHGIHVWADAKLYTPVLKQDNMFPLSYPATAKTLMARYGLLDLEQREQQEELQYNSDDGRFNYPPQQVYCSVQSDKKVIVLASLEQANGLDLTGLANNKYHLNLTNDASLFAKQLVYGIPPNLLNMTSAPPVATELLNAFDVSTYQYITDKQNDAEFASFANDLNSLSSGFFVGILSQEQLASIELAQIINTHPTMVIVKNEQAQYQMWSNFVDNTQVSSNEDVIPSVLVEFGCIADPNRYSTGQALQRPTRQWLVTTQDKNLVVVNYPQLTVVARDGSYEITDLATQEKVLLDLDTNLLSRSIKHLKDFSDR